MTDKAKTYEALLREAKEDMGHAVVMVPRAYAQDLDDHVAQMEDEGPVVVCIDVHHTIQDITVRAWLVRRVDREGYVDENTDLWAIIVSHEDYDALMDQDMFQARR